MSLGARELELLGLIAESNRANVSHIHSLDCYYSHDFANPVQGCEPLHSADDALAKKLAKKGRYAFSGNREYSREEIVSGNEGGVLFVRNGSRVWTRSGVPTEAPGLVGIGTASNPAMKPGTPPPFKLVDNGLSERLDALDPQNEGRVISVGTEDVGGEGFVQVVVSRSVRLPEDGRSEITLWFAPHFGYTLSKRSSVSSGVPGCGKEDMIRSVGEVTWKRFNVNGSSVYLPLETRSTDTLNRRVLRREDYAIDPTSVRINVDLPDELFMFEVKPDDQVMDLDAGIQLRTAKQGGPDFLLDDITGAALLDAPGSTHFDSNHFGVEMVSMNRANGESAGPKASGRAKMPDVVVSPQAITIELSDREVRSSTGNTHNAIFVIDRWAHRLEVSDVATSAHLAASSHDITYRCPTGRETHVIRIDTQLLPSLPAGPFAEWLSFATNHPDHPSVTVPINGYVR